MSIARFDQRSFSVFTKCALNGTDVTHTHPSIEFHFLDEGKGLFHSGKVRTQMIPGIVTVIHGFALHRVSSHPSNKYVRSVIHVPIGWVQKALSFLNLEQTAILPGPDRPIVQYRPKVTDYTDLRRIYRKSDQRYRLDRDSSDTVMSLYVAELIYILSRGQERNVDDRVSPYDEWLISRINDMLNDSQSPTFYSVNDLAWSLGVTRAHLWRVFVDVLGVSPREYLFERHMELAKESLLSGMSVSEVARKTGYSNVPAFSRAFKKYVGLSPSMFLRSIDRS